MLRSIILFSFILFFSSVVFGQSIIGSAHDFTNASWNTTNSICIVCHTPHFANIDVGESPLWNHQLTTSTFTPYSSNTLTASVGQPDGISKLCLSCHDGTVALDNFGATTTGTNFISGTGLIGTNLNNDHPVSFTYDANLANQDGELFDPTITNSGLGGTITSDMLFGGKLQCASCHDVHNSTGIDNLLLVTNDASALCLTCHNK